MIHFISSLVKLTFKPFLKMVGHDIKSWVMIERCFVAHPKLSEGSLLQDMSTYGARNFLLVGMQCSPSFIHTTLVHSYYFIVDLLSFRYYFTIELHSFRWQLRWCNLVLFITPLHFILNNKNMLMKGYLRCQRMMLLKKWKIQDL